jgi:hypothetical protein
MIGYDAKGWKVICYSRDKKKLARELNYWPGYAGKQIVSAEITEA